MLSFQSNGGVFLGTFGRIRAKILRTPKHLPASTLMQECPTITALVSVFEANAFNDKELLKLYLAGGNRIINFCGQTDRKRHG